MFKSFVIKNTDINLILAPSYTIADVKSNERRKGNRTNQGTGTGEDCRAQEHSCSSERICSSALQEPRQADGERPRRNTDSFQGIYQPQGKGKAGKRSKGLTLPSHSLFSKLTLTFLYIDLLDSSPSYALFNLKELWFNA